MAAVFRIRPIETAAYSLVFTFERLGPLFTAFAVPEALRLVIFAFAQGLESPAYLIAVPDRLLSAISWFLSAIVFGEIVRYVAEDKPVHFIPFFQPMPNYVFMIILFVVAGVAIDVVSDTSIHISLYLGTKPFEGADYTAIALMGWGAFAISIMVGAVAFPIAGRIVLLERDVFAQAIRGLVKRLPALLILSAIVLSMLLGFRRLWWFAYGLTGWAAEGNSGGNFSTAFGKSLVEQLPQIPVDLVFDILPAVTVGLIWRNLRGSSARL